ncbi:MAG TPA: aminotransferase class III-fold pyridoxal phosphate-dependent enzyme [Thioploca sp.]|nr:aminotransferase class III-fold pyridoxal phosphate-dependent enzyme [Thioploca sp.]
MITEHLVEPKDNKYYLQRQNNFESHARSYPRRIPIAIAKAQGINITDVNGKTYIDCLAGAGTLALGHNHPVVIEAIQQTLQSGLPLHTLDLTSPIKDQFCENILNSLPMEFANNARIQFCGPAGTDAVEAAIKLAKTATGRRTICTFQGGYHGMTHGALALTGNKEPKMKVPNLMSDVHFLPYPYTYRCPFGVGGNKGEEIGIHFIGRLLNDPESGVLPPAAIILEAIQGEGGVIPAPNKWLRKLRTITKEHKIPLILDEVQTGVGRTGSMYAFEQAEIIPDIVVLSKAIGGSLPMAVIVYNKELDVWSSGAHAGTFRGNTMAMAAGSATLHFIQEQQLLSHVQSMGKRLVNRFNMIQADTIGEVRGRGLMIGVEIVNKKLPPDHLGSFPTYNTMATRIQQECFKLGLIVELGGRNSSTLRFLPPLIINAEQIDTVALLFEDAIKIAESYD